MTDKKKADDDIIRGKSGRPLTRYNYEQGKREPLRRMKLDSTGKPIPRSELKKEETMPDRLQQIQEAAKTGALHPKHVHVHSTGKNEFTIHSVGHQAHPLIKKGQTVSSSDLDDFRQMGHKVKETKAPKA